MVINLILSVAFSTILGIIFKWFGTQKIHLFNAIVINYGICVLVSALLLGEIPISTHHEPVFFKFSTILGSVFISGFFIIGLTFQKFGLSLTTLMQKMSIIISVPFAILMFGELATPLKVAAACTAALAIYLMNNKSKSGANQRLPKWMYMLPALTLLIAAVVEILLQFVDHKLDGGSQNHHFLATAFGTAACLGGLVLIGRFILYGVYPKWKDLLGGVVLGVPNYLALFYMLKCLEVGWDASLFFPINNVMVLLISVLLGWMLYQEKLTRANLVGIAMALISIVLLSFS